jgi:hypothetical protein
MVVFVPWLPCRCAAGGLGDVVPRSRDRESSGTRTMPEDRGLSTGIKACRDMCHSSVRVVLLVRFACWS